VAKPPPLDLEPGALAERQLESDRARTARFPELLARKMTRMSASPLATLRGAAPLFFEILRARPELAEGPGGEGWIVGDLHLENFGAYKPDPLAVDSPVSGDGKGDAKDKDPKDAKKQRHARFDLNDFDDATIGPWRLDVLRLTTSLLLGGRELGANGVVSLTLCDALLEAWARSAFEHAPLPPAPPPVEALVEQVRNRSRAALLGARTQVVSGKRRFVRGPRYADLPADVLAAVPSAFERYAAALPDEDRPAKAALEIVDLALRIAGTGSLGGLRVAVLVKGKGTPEGHWIFDMKEQGSPSSEPVVQVPAALAPAERVMSGFRGCVERPPRMMGSTRLEGAGSFSGLSMFVRRLSPQEDKLDLRRLRAADLPALAAHLGGLVGCAHARGATKPPRARWSPSDLSLLRRHAIALAGMHEAVYLALCERMRPHLV